MSCRCGPNCLRKQGLRHECVSCNRARRKASGGENGAGGPRSIIYINGRQRAVDFGEHSNVARAAGYAFGLNPGDVGRFMQGAAAFWNGKPEPRGGTTYRRGYDWARDREADFAEQPK